MPEHKSGDEIERVLKVRQIPKNIAKNPCEKGVGEPKNPFAHQQSVGKKAIRFASRITFGQTSSEVRFWPVPRWLAAASTNLYRRG